MCNYILQYNIYNYSNYKWGQMVEAAKIQFDKDVINNLIILTHNIDTNQKLSMLYFNILQM